MDKPTTKKSLETRQKIRNRVRQMRTKQSDTAKDSSEGENTNRDKTRQQISDLWNSMRKK